MRVNGCKWQGEMERREGDGDGRKKQVFRGIGDRRFHVLCFFWLFGLELVGNWWIVRGVTGVSYCPEISMITGYWLLVIRL